MEGRPSIVVVGSANTMEEGTLGAIQDVPGTHQGMHGFSFVIFSRNIMVNLGELSPHGQGSKHIVDVE